MRPRLGFALSLLAACGIHAIVLFVPRAAFVQDVHVPTVEVVLTEVTGPQDAAAPRAPVIPPPIAAQKPAQVEAPAQPETLPPGPFAAPEPSGTEPPSATASGRAETPVIDQPVVDALPAVDTAAVSSGAENVTVQSPAGGASSAAAYSPAAPSPGGSSPAGAAPGGAAGASTSIVVPAFIPPRPVSEVLPTYPLSARRSGFEGVVKVGVMVDDKGAVTEVEVLSSSGHASLDQAVLDALRHARFAPAQQDGRPVPARVVIPVRFRLSSVAH